MKIKENVTLYKCDFCKKEMKRKHSMIKHEIECNNNPNNSRPCLQSCKYLERKEIDVDTSKEDYGGEPIFKTYSTFYCALKEEFLLHPKLQYKNGAENLKHAYLKETEEEITQHFMPIECDEHNSIYDIWH